jgi:hypothetical protein
VKRASRGLPRPALTEEKLEQIAPRSEFRDGQAFIIGGPLPVEPEGSRDAARRDVPKNLYVVVRWDPRSWGFAFRAARTAPAR